MKNFLLLIAFSFITQTNYAQKTIDLYWDSSYSMKDRNLQNELIYLNNYFNKYPDTKVNLICSVMKLFLKNCFQLKKEIG